MAGCLVKKDLNEENQEPSSNFFLELLSVFKVQSWETEVRR